MKLQGELATDMGIEGLERLLPQAVVRRDVAEQGGRKPAVGLAVLWREVHSGRCAIGHVVNGWQAPPKESDERRRARATGAAHLVHRRPLVALLDVPVKGVDTEDSLAVISNACAVTAALRVVTRVRQWRIVGPLLRVAQQVDTHIFHELRGIRRGSRHKLKRGTGRGLGSGRMLRQG